MRRFRDDSAAFLQTGDSRCQPSYALGRYHRLSQASQGASPLSPKLDLHRAMDPNDLPDDFWVFGYGSLMWRPGFAVRERVEARLIGAHRALCVYSFVHRGTPERPGLVLGLDRGGACRGIAYRVAAAERTATVAYLRAREQVTSVYRESMRRVWLEGEPEKAAAALCYRV